VKHEFKDELRIKVEHEHEHHIEPEVVEAIIGKAVDGAVTIIVASTVATVVKRLVGKSSTPYLRPPN
jgi:hypothetical protein